MEVTFNPETGSAEITRDGIPVDESLQPENNKPSALQHYAEQNDRHHTKAGADLARRASNPGQIDPVGSEQDAELFELQKQHQLAIKQGDHMLALQLEQVLDDRARGIYDYPQQEQVQPKKVVKAPAKEEAEKVSEELEDARARFNNDPAVTETLEWAAANLSEELLTTAQAGLESSDPLILAETVQLLQASREAAKYATSYESPEDVGELTENQQAWFATEYSDQVATKVTQLNAAVRSGKVTMDQAFAYARAEGLIDPMIRASQELKDFEIARF